MREITEKPDLMNTITVKVWTEAEIERFVEIGKPSFRANYWKNGHRNEFS